MHLFLREGEVCDMSTNGTFLNGERLAKSQWTALRDGDVVAPIQILKKSVDTITAEQFEHVLALFVYHSVAPKLVQNTSPTARVRVDVVPTEDEATRTAIRRLKRARARAEEQKRYVLQAVSYRCRLFRTAHIDDVQRELARRNWQRWQDIDGDSLGCVVREIDARDLCSMEQVCRKWREELSVSRGASAEAWRRTLLQRFPRALKLIHWHLQDGSEFALAHKTLFCEQLLAEDPDAMEPFRCRPAIVPRMLRSSCTFSDFRVSVELIEQGSRRVQVCDFLIGSNIRRLSWTGILGSKHCPCFRGGHLHWSFLVPLPLPRSRALLHGKQLRVLVSRFYRGRLRTRMCCQSESLTPGDTTFERPMVEMPLSCPGRLPSLFGVLEEPWMQATFCNEQQQVAFQLVTKQAIGGAPPFAYKGALCWLLYLQYGLVWCTDEGEEDYAEDDVEALIEDVDDVEDE
jgi:hypothetical protein